MCLSPVQIVNPSKYVSLKYKDRFLLDVPCGHCAECQQNISNQWYFRTYYECRDADYIYFDTLTYRNTPKMCDIIPDLPKISCFSRSHIRHFIEALRIDVQRKYKSRFRFFLAAEYGHDNLYKSSSGLIRRGTLRPHYHVMFFIPDVIPLVEFSSLVAKHWYHGITDGYPYKSKAYVLEHNSISSKSLPLHYLRACSYVTKYVQKSCVFDKTIEKHLNNAMFSISKKIQPDNPDGWLDTIHAKRVRMCLKRHLSQFHTQSKGFGESFLNEFDLKSYIGNGCVFMPSSKGLKIPITLSTYYKRKMFYDLIEIDGTKTWQLNQTGLYVRQQRQRKLIDDLANRFYCASLTHNLGYSKDLCSQLSDYVFNEKGRIKATFESTDFLEKLRHVTLYNYVTLSDKEHLTKRGLSFRFLGNNSIGYRVDYMPGDYIPLNEFIGNHVIYDSQKEKCLSSIYYHLGFINEKKQSAFSLKQDLENKYKLVRSLYLSNQFGGFCV